MKTIINLALAMLFLISIYSCEKPFEIIQKDKVAVIHNTVYTDVDYADIERNMVIQIDLSYIKTFDSWPHSYTASTWGKTSDNYKLGETITWSKTLESENDTVFDELYTDSDYFYLILKNSSSKSYGPIVVNYDNVNQITEEIVIPANSPYYYTIAYYRKRNDTKIRLYNYNNQNDHRTFTAGVNFNFEGSNNPYLILEIENSKSGISQIHDFPEYTRLIPSINQFKNNYKL